MILSGPDIGVLPEYDTTKPIPDDWGRFSTVLNALGLSTNSPPRTNATNALTGGFGVVGDGIVNDTAAITAAITAALASNANLWNGYHVLYFPAGTYICHNLTVTSKNNLMFLGDGWASVLKRGASIDDTPLATFTDVENIWLRDLAFDHNGVTQFGGTKFAGARNLIIENTYAFDNVNTVYAQGNDRYAWVFPNGGPLFVTSDVIFRNNLVEDLQCEFDNVRRLLVDNNDFVRGPTTAAVGTWAVDDDTIQEDITYSNNRIWDPHNLALALLLDSALHSNTIWKRIKVINNKFIMGYRSAPGIHVGIADTTQATVGNIWQDINISGNELIYASTAASVADSFGIHFSAASISAFIFDRVNISNNIVDDPASLLSFGYRLRFLRNSRVFNNRTHGTYVGFQFANFGATQFRRNLHETIQVFAASRAYEFISSLSTASVFDANFYSGGPDDVTINDGSTGGDTINAPTALAPKRIPAVLTADLPLAGTNMNGTVFIEDAGAGNRNIIVYAGGERFRIDGGANV